jgi:hypothetical protein
MAGFFTAVSITTFSCPYTPASALAWRDWGDAVTYSLDPDGQQLLLTGHYQGQASSYDVASLDLPFNSRYVDWLPDSNKMLVLTWPADVALWQVDLLHDAAVTQL